MSKKDEISEVAELACLKIEEARLPEFQSHFKKVMEYFENLNELDTSNVEPMVTPHGIYSELRADEVNRDLTVDEVLENAPDVKDSLFKVPPVV